MLDVLSSTPTLIPFHSGSRMAAPLGALRWAAAVGFATLFVRRSLAKGSLSTSGARRGYKGFYRNTGCWGQVGKNLVKALLIWHWLCLLLVHSVPWTLCWCPPKGVLKRFKPRNDVQLVFQLRTRVGFLEDAKRNGLWMYSCPQCVRDIILPCRLTHHLVLWFIAI